MKDDGGARCVLGAMAPGEGGVADGFAGGGAARQRLLELGFVRGAAVEVVRLSPLGDPMEVAVSGRRVAIRRRDAACVRVRRPG